MLASLSQDQHIAGFKRRRLRLDCKFDVHREQGGFHSEFLERLHRVDELLLGGVRTLLQHGVAELRVHAETVQSCGFRAKVFHKGSVLLGASEVLDSSKLVVHILSVLE